MIISGGENIHPKEIENALCAQPGNPRLGDLRHPRRRGWRCAGPVWPKQMTEASQRRVKIMYRCGDPPPSTAPGGAAGIRSQGAEPASGTEPGPRARAVPLEKAPG
jgi:acyl-CoA synthetase (AMP-forming)/AMP-acid ligase II